MFEVIIVDKSRPIVIDNRLQGYHTTVLEVEAPNKEEAYRTAVYEGHEVVYVK